MYISSEPSWTPLLLVDLLVDAMTSASGSHLVEQLPGTTLRVRRKWRAISVLQGLNKDWNMMKQVVWWNMILQYVINQYGSHSWSQNETLSSILPKSQRSRVTRETRDMKTWHDRWAAATKRQVWHCRPWSKFPHFIQQLHLQFIFSGKLMNKNHENLEFIGDFH